MCKHNQPLEPSPKEKTEYKRGREGETFCIYSGSMKSNRYRYRNSISTCFVYFILTHPLFLFTNSLRKKIGPYNR